MVVVVVVIAVSDENTAVVIAHLVCPATTKPKVGNAKPKVGNAKPKVGNAKPKVGNAKPNGRFCPKTANLLTRNENIFEVSFKIFLFDKKES
jgi:hypothetical protein|nr:MAG: hypothetical protein [Lake Baikal virophage 3]